MAGAKLSVGQAPPRTAIVSGDKPAPPPRLHFSFQYWQQIRYFGLSKIGMDWVIEFMARLRELSRFTRDDWDNEVLGNRRGGDRWHYHRVEWDATNIPISKAQLDWVPKQILENEDEFAFWQFGLGAGGGRFAGFWETDERFAIVLLDPHHNLYPVKRLGYRVVDCAPHAASAALIHLAVDQARGALTCKPDECPAHATLAEVTLGKRVDAAYVYTDVVPVGLEESDRRRVAELLEYRRIRSLNEVFKRGLDSLEEQWINEESGTTAPPPDATD